MRPLTLASRAAQGGATAAAPWDGARWDWDLLTGPKPATTLAAASSLTLGGNDITIISPQTKTWHFSALSALNINYLDATGLTAVQVFSPGGAIRDCKLGLQVQTHDTLTTVGRVKRVYSNPSLAAIMAKGANSFAIGITGSVRYTNVDTPGIDGVAPGTTFGNPAAPWSVVEDTNIVSWGDMFYSGQPYGGGAPGAGNAGRGSSPTIAEIKAAVPFVAGMTVTAGQLFYANTNGWYMYQALADGTLGTTITGWPTTPYVNLAAGNVTQPFTSGSASLICVGQGQHTDGLQTSSNRRIVVRRCRVLDWSNSIMLIQSAGAGVPSDFASGYNVPVMNVVWEDCLVRPAGTVWYVQGQAPAETGYPADGSSRNSQGAYLRSSTTGVWSLNSTAYKTRPWYVSFRRVKILDQAVKSAVVATAPMLGVPATFAGNVFQCYGAMIVPSEAVRDAGVAAQYGWSANDPRLAQMRQGTFDWNNSNLPTPISSVLEARYQKLLAVGRAGLGYPGQCDARAWIVCEPSVVNSAGTPITPAMAGNAYYAASAGVFDSNGYYIGG